MHDQVTFPGNCRAREQGMHAIVVIATAQATADVKSALPYVACTSTALRPLCKILLQLHEQMQGLRRMQVTLQSRMFLAAP